MIPTIEKIVCDLFDGEISKAQAIAWLHQHAAEAGRDFRDDLAAGAMAGLCADRHHSDTQGSPRAIALMAYEIADEMIVERSKSPLPVGRED